MWKLQKIMINTILRCSSQKTSCIPAPRTRSASTSWSASCNTPTATSWTSSAPAVTRSPPSSVTRRRSCSASAAAPSYANPRGEGPGSQKVIIVVYFQSLPIHCTVQSGAAACKKCFLQVLLLAWAAWQLQYSPTACGCRKTLNKTFRTNGLPRQYSGCQPGSSWGTHRREYWMENENTPIMR